MSLSRSRRRTASAALAVWLLVTALAVSGCGDQQAPAQRDGDVDGAFDGAGIVTTDGVLTLPGGRTVDTGVTGGINYLGVLEDGRVVVSGLTSPDDHVVRVFGTDGTVESTYPRGEFEGVSISRSAAVWTDGDRRLHVLRSGESEPLALARPPVATPDNDSLAFEVWRVDCDGPAADCAVVVHYDETITNLPPGYDRDVSLRVTADGWAELEPGEPDGRVVSTSRDGRVEVVRDDDYCVDLRETGGASLGHTCRAGVSVAVSPDGEHVVMVLGSEIVVHDQALERLRTIPVPAGMTFLDQVWNDDDSLLMVFMGDDEVVPDPAPGGDRPGGQYEWFVVEVPINGDEATVRTGPVVGPHHDTNRWAFSLVEA